MHEMRYRARRIWKGGGTLRSLVAAALVLGVLGSYTASAHLDDQMTQGELGQPETLTARLDNPRDRIVDLGKEGESRADRFYLRHRLLDDSGTKIGHGLVICEQYSKRVRLFFCQEEDHITGRGTILSAGFQDLRALPITILQIVGGTGEFKNSRGQTVLDFSGPSVSFELLP